MLGQTTLPLVFRDFATSDYERLVEIYDRNYPDYALSVEEFRHNDESTDRTKYHLKRYACQLGGSGKTVGFARIAHAWWNFHSQKYFVEILVDPDYQGRGVGSWMSEKMDGELRSLKATTAWTRVIESKPRSLVFAEKRGFVERKRDWESRLNPQEFDQQPFQEYLDRVSHDGIRITTLAEEMVKGPGVVMQVYELDQDCWEDCPLPTPYTRVSFEQWEAKQFRDQRLLRDGYFIAVDGARYVGYSSVWRVDKEPRTLFQYMTGVRREYRGRDIAMALKLRVIDFARRSGYDKIMTANDSENAAMLAINNKLGFKRQVGWILMEKKLD